MAIRYTKQQTASPFFEEYKKERARLQSFARSAKARGITLPTDFVPDVPQKITAGSVRKLQRITPEHGYYTKASFRAVDPTTGEVFESTRGTKTSIERAISKYRASVRSTLDSKPPLSRAELDSLISELESREVTARNIFYKKRGLELDEEPKDTKPEPIDTTPQDVIDDSGDYWYEDTYETDESDYEYEEPDYEEADSNFDEAFDSDYHDEFDRINMDRQIEKTQEQIDRAIDYIGNNVSGHMADAVRDLIDQFQSSMSDEAWAILMDDEDFWDDIADVVEDHYKSKKDPMPEVINRIRSKLAGRPMTMEENSKFEDYINSNDSESYSV